MTIAQLSVRRTLRIGRNGQLYDANTRLYHEDAYEIGGDRTNESVVVDLTGAAANSTTYSFTFGDETISYTSDANATATEIYAGLKAAFDANPVAFGLASSAATGTELTISGRFEGSPLPVEVVPAAGLDAVKTTASEGAPLPFGRAVVADTGTDRVKLPVAGSAAADFIGVSIMTYDEMSNTVGNATVDGYRVGTSARILRTGRIIVEGAQADVATSASQVWIERSVSADKGKFFTSNGSGTCVQITDGSIKWLKANVIEIRRGL